MTVKASNCNAPIWRDVTVKACLPAELANLDKVARNLWTLNPGLRSKHPWVRRPRRCSK